MTRPTWILPCAVALVASVAAAPTPAAGQSRLRDQVDTTQVTVGDHVTLTVTVDHPAGARVVWPDSLDLAPFEVLAARTPQPTAESDSLRSVAVLTLTAFELGALEIPSFDVEVVGPGETADTLETDRFGVEVVSVGTDEGGDIRDIRGPLSIPLSVLRLALWALLGGLAGLALWLTLRRLRRARGRGTPLAPPSSPLRPAHEEALEALARLEASPLLEQGEVKEYHIQVSDILRRYVEARFRVQALEMTTREVLEGLDRARVDGTFRDGFERFLAPCDRVKFAKARPGAEASREVLVLGRRLVESSTPEPGHEAGEPAAAERTVGVV